jgi:hypothetical protein
MTLSLPRMEHGFGKITETMTGAAGESALPSSWSASFWALDAARQIIRAATGIFRSSTVSTQLMESVPANTIANLTKAGKAGS